MTERTFVVNKVNILTMTQTLWSFLADAVTRGDVTLTASRGKRTNDQNKLLHATLSEIARKKEWGGKKHHPDTWKRLFTAAWMREQGINIEILPALDGHGVDLIPIRTSKLTKSQCSDMIEWINSWAAENIDESD
jgi:hypothetical protein